VQECKCGNTTSTLYRSQGAGPSFSDSGFWKWNLDSGARRLLEAAPTRAALPMPNDRALSLRSDGAVVQWDLETEQAVSIWPERARYVQSLLPLSATRVLVRSGEGCELFDASNGCRIEFGATHADRRVWVLGPDAFMSFDDDDKLVVWDAAEGSRLCSLHGAGETVTALRVDEQRVLTGAADGSVILWSLVSGEIVWRKLLHRKRVSKLLALHEGTFLSYSWDGSLVVDDIEAAPCSASSRRSAHRSMARWSSPIAAWWPGLSNRG
jgi:WD40 repeat protein